MLISEVSMKQGMDEMDSQETFNVKKGHVSHVILLF